MSTLFSHRQNNCVVAKLFFARVTSEPIGRGERRVESAERANGIHAFASGRRVDEEAEITGLDTTELGAREIVEKGLQIAGDICVYTNQNHSFEELNYSA